MFKIAITGKANSGKNTLSRMIVKQIKKQEEYHVYTKYFSFATPIKRMASIMFPELPSKFFYSSSKFRNEIIPNAFKDGNPLTVRQLLIDLGTELGRSYNENIWINAFDHELNLAIKTNRLIIVTDVRFENEFEYLKKKGFYQIKLNRHSQNSINHISETNQDSISDNKYDFIVDNNGSLKDLKNKVVRLVEDIRYKEQK